MKARWQLGRTFTVHGIVSTPLVEVVLLGLVFRNAGVREVWAYYLFSAGFRSRVEEPQFAGVLEMIMLRAGKHH